MPSPLLYRWEGDCFTVAPRHAKEADHRFVIGEIYALDEIKERSSKSHAQYFAAIQEGWLSLPEAIAADFPTTEKLRKHCLIKSGFYDRRSIQCSSRAEALRLAAFIRPMDEYAIVTVTGSLVTVYTAQSQSYKAMGKQMFEESKRAVLNYIDDLLRVSRGETEKQGAES